MSMKIEIEGAFLGFGISATGKHSAKVSVINSNGKENTYRIGALRSNAQSGTLPAMYTLVRVAANDCSFYDMNGQKGVSCADFEISAARSSSTSAVK